MRERVCVPLGVVHFPFPDGLPPPSGVLEVEVAGVQLSKGLVYVVPQDGDDAPPLQHFIEEHEPQVICGPSFVVGHHLRSKEGGGGGRGKGGRRGRGRRRGRRGVPGRPMRSPLRPCRPGIPHSDACTASFSASSRTCSCIPGARYGNVNNMVTLTHTSQVHVYTRTHTRHTYAHTHTHTFAHTHTHAQPHTLSLTHTPYTHPLTHTHSLSYTHTLTHIHTSHSHTHTPQVPRRTRVQAEAVPVRTVQHKPNSVGAPRGDGRVPIQVHARVPRMQALS